MKQALRSSRVPVPSPGQSESESESEFPFWQKGRGGNLQAHCNLISLFKRQTENICQPNPTHPLLHKHCKGSKRQLTHPAWGTKVLRTVLLGAGRKGSAPKKRLVGKLGFLGRKYCTEVLCCAVLYSTVLLAIGRCTHSNICASAWLGLPSLPSPESHFAVTRSSLL